MAVDGLDGTRVSRAEAVVRRLSEEITTGALPAGTRLGTKSDLRERFGVAVATINEAVRMLEMRGLIEARPGPGGGVFVARPEPLARLRNLTLTLRSEDSLVTDSLVVRDALEPLICAEAGAHRTKKDIRDLRRALKVMEQNVDDLTAYLRANWALHRRIAEMSRNHLLTVMYTTVLELAEASLKDVLPDDRFTREEVLEVHRRLVDAIASGDQDEVVAAVAAHDIRRRTLRSPG
jgi:DNA-binding FadR family transcriptional regulator